MSIVLYDKTDNSKAHAVIDLQYLVDPVNNRGKLEMLLMSGNPDLTFEELDGSHSIDGGFTVDEESPEGTIHIIEQTLPNTQFYNRVLTANSLNATQIEAECDSSITVGSVLKYHDDDVTEHETTITTINGNVLTFADPLQKVFSVGERLPIRS